MRVFTLWLALAALILSISSGAMPMTGLVVGDTPIVWTDWLDRDDQGGKGDYESLVDFPAGTVPCSIPVAIECAAVPGYNPLSAANYPRTGKPSSAVSYTATGEVVVCESALGGWCINDAQPDGKCDYDYIVRFACPNNFSIIPAPECDSGTFQSRQCNVSHGKGVQGSDCVLGHWTLWGTCNLQSCDSGYGNVKGACVPLECNDSDGLDYLTKGTVLYNGTVLEDYCLNNEQLDEWTCSGGVPNQVSYSCPGVCSEGACTSKPTGCFDSDGGVVVREPGTASGFDTSSNFFKKTDYCANSQYVVEYYCSNGLLADATYSCGDGFTCMNGACLKNVSACRDNEVSLSLIEKSPVRVSANGNVYYLELLSSNIEKGTARIKLTNGGKSGTYELAEGSEATFSKLRFVFDALNYVSKSTNVAHICAQEIEDENESACAEDETQAYVAKGDHIVFTAGGIEYIIVPLYADAESESVLLLVNSSSGAEMKRIDMGSTVVMSGLSVHLEDVFFDAANFTAELCMKHDGTNDDVSEITAENENSASCNEDEASAYVKENSPIVYVSGGVEYRVEVISGNAEKNTVIMRVRSEKNHTAVRNMNEGETANFSGLLMRLSEAFYDSDEKSFTAEVCFIPQEGTFEAILENEDETSQVAGSLPVCDGCVLEGSCFTFGYRSEAGYCGTDREWLSFRNKGNSCLNNFECSSNLCLDGQCVEKGFFKRLARFLSSLR